MNTCLCVFSLKGDLLCEHNSSNSCSKSLIQLCAPCRGVFQVSEESCRAQFLVPVTAQGQNRAKASLERAQNLNPMVKVHADPDRIEDKPDDFFLQFDAVSLTC